MYMVKRLVSLFTLVCLLSACSDNRLEELRKDDSGEQGKAWLTLTISLPSEAVSRSSTGGQGGTDEGTEEGTLNESKVTLFLERWWKVSTALLKFRIYSM